MSSMKLLIAILAILPAYLSAAVSSRADKAGTLSRVLRTSINPRKLDEDASALTISVNESIQFNTCISLTTELTDDMKTALSTYDIMRDYYDDGEIVPLKSYVLFDICETEKCSYGDESNLYITDLSSYMALTSYKPQQTIGYCNACVEAMDWCMNGQSSDGTDDGAAADGDRRLESIQYVDCDMCTKLNCFDAATEDDGTNDKITVAKILQWAQDWSQCQETGVEWNDIALYATFMCNAEGTGVELGVFLDEDCTTYSKVQPFGELFPNSAYHLNSGNVVTYPFTQGVDCAEEVQWESPENANGDDSQNNDEPQVNQYCQAVVQSDFVLPLANCNGGQNNGQAADQDEQEQKEGDDSFSDWEYDISEDDAQDVAAVCSTIKALEQENGSYKGAASAKNHYKEVHGSFYKYNKSQATSGKGGMIAGILLGVFSGCAVGFYAWKRTQRKEKKPLLDKEIQEELSRSL